jgi:hypothetical protein
VATKTLFLELELTIQADADPAEVAQAIVEHLGNTGGNVRGFDGVENAEASTADAILELGVRL